jgi:hypothetical protein
VLKINTSFTIPYTLITVRAVNVLMTIFKFSHWLRSLWLQLAVIFRSHTNMQRGDSFKWERAALFYLQTWSNNAAHMFGCSTKQDLTLFFDPILSTLVKNSHFNAFFLLIAETWNWALSHQNPSYSRTKSHPTISNHTWNTSRLLTLAPKFCMGLLPTQHP